MKEASKKELEIVAAELSARGYRITEPRKKIIAALIEAAHPLSALALAKLVSADTASVYRTLALLLEEGFVEVIETRNSAPRYALAHGHHHHVVCDTCGHVEHIPCTGEFGTPKKVKGFKKITHHEVTYHAHCDTCA